MQLLDDISAVSVTGASCGGSNGDDGGGDIVDRVEWNVTADENGGGGSGGGGGGFAREGLFGMLSLSLLWMGWLPCVCC